MRAGYLAVALAVLGAVLVTAALATVGRRPPATVNAALGLDRPEPPGLEPARAAAVARQTSACMAGRGWHEPIAAEPAVAIPDADLDPVAWADRWGFGITTALPGTGPPGAVDARPSSPAEVEPAARGRFAADLDGDGIRPGCRTLATANVYGMRERVLEPLRGQLVDLERAIAADPGARGVAEAWRRCVAPPVVELGLDEHSIDRASLPARLIATLAARLRSVDRDPPAVAALRVLERRVAGRIARCELGYVAGMATVASPHERAFVLTHRRALSAARAQLQASERQWLEAATSGG